MQKTDFNKPHKLCNIYAKPKALGSLPDISDSKKRIKAKSILNNKNVKYNTLPVKVPPVALPTLHCHSFESLLANGHAQRFKDKSNGGNTRSLG